MPPVTAVTTTAGAGGVRGAWGVQPARHPAGPGLHSRACAGAALVSAVLHLVMAGQHSDLWWQTALMLVMALLCLPCVLPLWRSGSAAAGRMMMVSALSMVAFHAVLLLFSGGSGAAHQHGAGAVVSVSADPASTAAAGTTFGMLALIGGELLVALLAATLLRRRAVPPCGPVPSAA
ncbi:hypothetical protein [Arthrobacter gengyunqii]|uniref:Uncharacterized protein n=1 Tax=Arthrobacter gengyunqii TaxID=2886940 RepID=A0ABS8GDR8_9MICC|nr:hypothetical protein [Arthrobacter gengyunqii]MCC3264772.1 hypothetical protein [Arthrobacter gengyunqii]